MAFQRIDDGMESDPVALLYNDEMRAVVFPTAESLQDLRKLDQRNKPLILVSEPPPLPFLPPLFTNRCLCPETSWCGVLASAGLGRTTHCSFMHHSCPCNCVY